MNDDDVTLGELGRRLTEMQATFIREMTGLRADSVLRAEYETRMTALDREVRDAKTMAASAQAKCAAVDVLTPQVQALKDEAGRRQVPWTSVASALCAVAALILTLAK